MILAQAIAERRERIAELAREVEQLEAAERIVGEVRAEAPVKPPPRPRAEKPVRAEPSTEKRARTKPGDATFACGHARSEANTSTQGKCRECKNASQIRYLAKKAGAPVPATKQLSKPEAPAPAKPALVAAPHAAAATVWQKQCPMLDFESGRRCSLMAPHPMPHNASGRTFTTAVNQAELGGTNRAASNGA